MKEFEPQLKTKKEVSKYKSFGVVLVVFLIAVIAAAIFNINLAPKFLGNSSGGGDVDDSTPNFVWDDPDYVEPDPPEDLPPEDIKIDEDAEVEYDDNGNPTNVSDGTDPDDLPEWDENDDDREPDGGLFPDGSVPEYDDSGVDPNANQTGEESGPTSSPEPGSEDGNDGGFVWDDPDYVEPDPPEDLPPEDIKIDQYDVPKDDDGNPIDNSDPDDLPEWDENDNDREPGGGLFPDGSNTNSDTSDKELTSNSKSVKYDRLYSSWYDYVNPVNWFVGLFIMIDL
jgi:hypothetical protein